jgi:hypothetical protein
MFREVAINVMENEEGITVRTLDRFTVIYADGTKRLTLYREGWFDSDNKHHEDIVLKLPLRWGAPHDKESLSIEDIAKIKAHLIEATIASGTIPHIKERWT